MKKHKMKKHNQSKVEKENFKSELLDLWLAHNGGKLITRNELAELWQKSDRIVRKEINRIANYFAVHISSQIKGYELALTPSTIQDNPFALKKQHDGNQSTIRLLNSYIEELQARLKPLIANDEICIKYLSAHESKTVESDVIMQ